MTASSWYSEAKTGIEAWTGLDKDALHIHAAILLYLLIAVVLRRRALWAWLAVLLVELANEALDLREQYQAGIQLDWSEALRLGWREAAKDVWNTMLWPSLFLVAARYLPQAAIIGAGARAPRSP
ncbi:MAG TPA: hypothetical protein VHM92_02340 [Allosphingosinicella sp.]|nr:hypothetical protein [Allosphingosinicella sp.]